MREKEKKPTLYWGRGGEGEATKKIISGAES